MPRRRRPRPLAWVILIALVLLLILLFRACFGGSAYATEVFGVAQETSDLGARVAQLPVEIEGLDRSALFERLSSWRDEARSHLGRAAELVPPEGFRISHGYLVAALGMRADALDRLVPAVRNALSDQDVEVVSAQVAGVMGDLSSADRVYELFLESWPDEEGPARSPWLPDEELATQVRAQAFVEELRGQGSLRAVYDLKVSSVSVEPKPAGQQDGIDVLPFVESLVVSVVVENVGNERVSATTVDIFLTSEEDPQPERASGRVGALEPGAKASVTFEGLSPTIGGPVNLLSVTVGPVGGEANSEDNTSEYKFLVREA